MQGTRDRVLELLLEQRSARAEDLATALDITVPAIRRHLDHLRADGLIDMRAVKQAMGRPYYDYFPTKKAIANLPGSYADLLARVLQSVDTSPAVVETVTLGMANAVASRHRDAMDLPAASAAERVDHVTTSLKQEGILQDWHAEADGFHLINGQCPYRVAAEVSSLPCESDRKAIAMLLEMDVQQVRRIVDGAACCEYVARPTNHQAFAAMKGTEPAS
ncbi:MAG: helix-turn-helix transcriptional regulator [Dehalococcoidia bacterium]